ncbi:zinc-binding alcohol dehydrogenase family protein [Herbiconiux sp. UC225_62]|uniref:zinc-binding alcohol dehydrogenase family protein n=1 Tax=Herbiconiux sp. UC225_62 TaxID=3350168 RepID=UPI0036D4087F
MGAPSGFPPAVEQGSALWLTSSRGGLHAGPAPVRIPGPTELVVKVRAVALNPIDAMNGIARRVVLPWLRFPAVLGSDVAGEITAVGAGVTDFAPGDRVVGYAVGIEKSRNTPAEGAFQTHVTLMEHLCSRIPDTVSFEQACVLPLALTTAAAGLFEHDQLALELPRHTPPERAETVLVFGGATSVGMNAIQLARNAGYRVMATSSPANAEALTTLGASSVLDYHAPRLVSRIVDELGGRPLAGTLAVASGSLPDAVAVNGSPAVTGTRRVASAHPTPVTALRAALARRRGVAVTAIWGATPKDTSVGPAIWRDFLQDALTDGRYRPAPEPVVVGHGLDDIPAALARLRQGVHASKLVVTV